ncbi:hypothetical protein COU37_00335 [Candidatus Micrarchaeota archaeon CG10_big_fil_rev_8_21_14_0_10_45_29]|nr:MAG: hypothetical protein COU37_00335 [Candidatus Micrarchaeota archaeon CG10_big_fil_rev_8_21_14_0_10_45_29]
MDEFEKSFAQTTKILLGAELGSFYDYSKWLSEHVFLPYCAKSKKSGKEVWLAPSRDFLGKKFDAARIVSMEEGEINKENSYSYEDIKDADLNSFRTKFCEPIALYLGNFRYKTHQNALKSSGTGDCVNVYMGEDVYHGARNIGFCKSMLYCENIFGCREGTNCKYCINCYGSTYLTRCFEMDSCTKCSDSYFCHNCENLENCLFCFNSKGLHYAIANIEVGKEKYMEIKKKILTEISQKLEKNKKLDISIFNIGARK